MDRQARLDAVRAIAISGVVLVHTSQLLGALLPEGLQILSGLGRFGVQLFFLLSGFLLYEIYARPRSHWNPKTFALRRFSRIYPLYLLFGVVWLAGVLTGLVSTPEAYFSGAVVAATFLLVNDLWWTSAWGFLPGAWSISAEAIHYAMFPALRKTRTRVLIIVLAVSTAASLLAGFIAYANTRGDYSGATGAYWSWINTLAPWNTIPFFVLGLAIGRYQANRGIALRPLHACGLVAVVVGGAAATAIFGSLTPIALAWVAALFLLIAGLDWTPPRWVGWLGRRSYATYFTHFVVLAIASGLILNVAEHLTGWPSLLILAATTGAVLLVSTVMSQVLWIAVEGPGIRMGRRFGRTPQ